MSGQHPSQSFKTLPFAQPTHCRRYDGIEIEMTSLMSSGQKRLEAALLASGFSPARRSAWLTMGLDDYPERMMDPAIATFFAELDAAREDDEGWEHRLTCDGLPRSTADCRSRHAG
jgi:hypothetical protein